ncbi:MAG: hypothetical protein MR754_09830 [Oribacterium sp.]|nr:hypothetical protein [Oribacterium sp.]
MNVDIAMGVIEEIARRLGVPAEQIVPELSRMNIVHHTFMCVAMAIVFLILLAGIIVCVKKLDDTECAIVPACIACFVIIVAVYQGHELVRWIESPQAMTIEYVMKYFV